MMVDSELVQVTFDYSLVSDEQARQLQTIYSRVFMRHVSTSYEDGKDLLEAKNIKKLPYETFIKWAHDCYGWSESIIVKKINRALNWGDFTLTCESKIDERAIDTLSTKKVPESARIEAKQRAEAGEPITEGVAKQIRDAHQAREEAEKQLTLFQSQVQSVEMELAQRASALEAQEKQIARLTKTIDELSTPIEVDKPETIRRIQELEDDLQQRTAQKKRLSERVKVLSSELDEQRNANKARQAQELYEFRVKDKLKKGTEECGKSIIQMLGQLPSPLESEVLSDEDWSRIDQVKDIMRQAIEGMDKLSHSRGSVIVNAG